MLGRIECNGYPTGKQEPDDRRGEGESVRAAFAVPSFGAWDHMGIVTCPPKNPMRAPSSRIEFGNLVQKNGCISIWRRSSYCGGMSTVGSADENTGARKVGFATRFLWFAAGADAELLRRCPVSDGVKYQGVGGIVLATAGLAFVSGSYAFYTVFAPKDETALSADLHMPTVQLAVLMGLVWAVIIFNIDRFIVSSTGKGDGTDRIAFGELATSFPRLLMAAIIGVCISAPLEIRVLKPEIDAQLELEQNEYLAELNAQSESFIQSRKDELHRKMDAAEGRLDGRTMYFEKRRLEIKEQRRLLELEAEGKTKSGIAGRGPAWQDKRDTLDKMEREIETDWKKDESKNKPTLDDLNRWKNEAEHINVELDAAKASNLRQARHLDGLMKRILISHEIGGMVPWFILLLLLAIETGPIFFKMMLTRGTYDYMLENARRVATARAGVEIDAQIYRVNLGKEIRVNRYHEAERVMEEYKQRLEAETALARAVHERLRKASENEIRKASTGSDSET